MRGACIDIGTNTTRLLVAEPDGGALREVVSVRHFLALRPDRDGIPPATVERLAAIVADGVRAARAHGVERVRVVGTAALRGAPNREAVCAAVLRAAGVAVEIISGEEEARLAFAGATGTLGATPSGLLGVVDVGGGSSELVAGTLADGVRWSASLPLGSGVLSDRHVRSDPPGAAELDAIRAEVRAALGAVRAPRPALALAVGGSATSLRGIVGEELDPGTLGRALAIVTGAPAAEIAARFEVAVERARLLAAGLLLLEEAWAAFGGAPLRIGHGGLREGVILQEVARGAPG